MQAKSSFAERTQLELWHAGEVPQSRNEHSWSYDMQAKSSFAERSQLELWHAGEIPQSLNEHTWSYGVQAKSLSRGTNTVGAMASRRSPSVAERTQLEL